MKRMYFLFSVIGLAFLFSACTKESDDSANPDTFPYFFTATINSKPIAYEANFVSRVACGSYSRLYLNSDDYDLYEGTVIKDSEEEGENKICVSVLEHFSSMEEPTAGQRLAMFRVGSYNYGRLNGMEGAVITYTDENSVEWNTEDGSQNGSTFALTEVEDDPYVMDAKAIKASFSCKLYASDGSNIQISNGKISGRVLAL